MYLPAEQIPIEDRIEQLLGEAVRRPTPAGSRTCSPTCQTRAGLIVTFLALLEMIRLKLVRVFQAGAMAPIRSITSGRGRSMRRSRCWIPNSGTPKSFQLSALSFAADEEVKNG